jgi:hypothetical protein
MLTAAQELLAGRFNRLKILIESKHHDPLTDLRVNIRK